MTIRASCQLDEVKSDEVTEFMFPCCKEALSFARSGRLILDVVDTGAGMTPEQVSKLFRNGVQFDVNDLVSFSSSFLFRVIHWFLKTISILFERSKLDKVAALDSTLPRVL